MKSTFSGNLYIFHAFDVGEDISLSKVEESGVLTRIPQPLPKYFSNYQAPLAVELPKPHPPGYVSSKIHEFGVISLTYKIPFNQSLEEVRGHIAGIDRQYQDQSAIDAHTIFDVIKPLLKQPKFFHLRSVYTVIQMDHDDLIDHKQLKETHGNTIAELVRFETESLADYQKQDLLDSSVGYYRGDFIIVDSDAAFVYDEDYEEFLGLFEFSNVQQLELRYFDQLLTAKLKELYERKQTSVPKRLLIPLMGLSRTPITELGRIRVDISVITEQLQSSIKLANEPYANEIYELLTEKLDLRGWKRAIDRKLEIIKDVNVTYHNRIETLRAEMLETLVIILILIEVILGVMK